MNDEFSDPLAYFLTWTTYGTWLPGDERGWVKKKEGVQESDSQFNKFTNSLAKQEPIKLSQDRRELVHKIIENTCQHRGWNLLALNIRTNHVHVVIEAVDPPVNVMKTLKSWATRALNDSCETSRKWWTKSGSHRLLFSEEAVENACRYTLEGQ